MLLLLHPLAAPLPTRVRCFGRPPCPLCTEPQLDWAASQGHTDVLELMIVYHFIKTLPPEEWDPSKKVHRKGGGAGVRRFSAGLIWHR